MSSGPRDYLRHILAEAEYLAKQGAGLTAERFMGDETPRRAFVRSPERSLKRFDFSIPKFSGEP